MNIVAHSMQSVKWGRAFPGSFGFWRPDIASFCLSVFSPSSLLYQPTCLSIYLSIHLCVCIYQFTGLSIYLSTYLSIWLSVYLSVCLSIYPFIYLSLSLCLCVGWCLSVLLWFHPLLSASVDLCISVYPSYLPVYLASYLSIYPSTSLSIYLSVYLSIFLSMLLASYLSIYQSIYPKGSKYASHLSIRKEASMRVFHHKWKLPVPKGSNSARRPPKKSGHTPKQRNFAGRLNSCTR